MLFYVCTGWLVLMSLSFLVHVVIAEDMTAAEWWEYTWGWLRRG
jgi:hypothetical protein